MVTYAMAYTEVLELLKCFPEEQLSRIPTEKIEFFKQNKDPNYNFEIKDTEDISKNNISRKAYAIIIALYNDYFLSENKKVTLKALLKQNDRIRESNKQQEYNLKNVIKKDNTKIDNIQENTSENMELIKVEEKNIFAKIMNKVKSMLNQLKKRLMKMVNDNFDRYGFA